MSTGTRSEPPGEPRKPTAVRRLLRVLGVIIAASFLLGPCVWHSRAMTREHSAKIRCASNLRQMGIASQLYLNEYGVYPWASGGRGMPPMLSPETDSCALLWTRKPLDDKSPPTTPLAACKVHSHPDGRNLLFLDGSVKWVTEREFERIYEKDLTPK